MSELIKPKEITITLENGEDKTYIISKFPCVEGREIIAKYPLSGIPKLGDYQVNEETMLKLMSYVAVPQDGNPIPLRLKNRALVNNHIDSWETLAKIEMEMMQYNCSFFRNGQISNFFADLAQKLPQLISKILTDSLAQLSQKEKPHSTN